MPKGYLFLVLHAHLPYVRHPEFDRFLEERWFFEAVTEPVLRPVRRIVPPLRVGATAVDLSPIIVWVVILIVRGLL